MNSGLARVVAILVFVFVMMMSRSATIAQPAPNIVMILTDDQGIDAIEGTHWPNTLDVCTPTLAALADQGRVFVNTRVEPRCSPTRAGLLTGRSAAHTGVTGPVAPHDLSQYVSLHTEELTIAEALAATGYHTIHIDKWHLAKLFNQAPRDQGFTHSVAKKTFFGLDDPVNTGDEHLTLMVDKAIKAVADRPRVEDPYALFFWTSDPHIRSDRTKRDPKGWWRVHKSLLPSEQFYYNSKREKDSQINRYRAVVEAIDTESRRLLLELGVIDGNLRYRAESNTVVIFMSDNGTPSTIAPDPANAKGFLYDGGIRVPLFFFGEGVPQDGVAMTEQISHLDLFETLADIADAPDHAREGGYPRDGMSFADLVGWGPPLPRRTHVVSAGEILYDLTFRACITDGNYKVIADAGNAGFKPLDGDEFFDLANDPNEATDIALEDMTDEQFTIYRDLRERLADEWPYSVPEPDEILDIDITTDDVRCLTSDDEDLQGTLVIGQVWIGRTHLQTLSTRVESRAFARFDVDPLWDELATRGKSIDDISSARIILNFEQDVHPLAGGSDSGLISAHEMEVDWRNGAASFEELADGFSIDVLGEYDPPPHLFAEAEFNFQIVPTPPGTPISMGRHDALRDAVVRWMNDPMSNFGLVLLSQPLPELEGDQRTYLMPTATLRVSLRNP